MTHPASGRIIICFLKKETGECSLRFKVHVQIDLGGHQVAWTMDMLPGMRVPIQLDADQQLIFIAHEQELLVDSSGMDRRFPIKIQEEALNQAEAME